MSFVSQVKIKSGAFEITTEPDEKLIEQTAINEAVRRAIQDNIVPSPDRLVIRDLLPDKDLLDGNGNKIVAREWREPVSGTYGTSNADVRIFQTGEASNYNKKVIVIYGAKQVGTSLYKTSGSLSAAAVTFEKGTSKVISIIDLQRLETSSTLRVMFPNPVIYGKGETATIKFWAKNTASGGFDNIMLLGKVIEPVGENVNG